jgi:signal transduction histidine kinase
MHSPAITVGAEQCITEALRLLGEKKISCLLVERDGVACGIVTEKDIVRCYADVTSGVKTFVAEIMTPAPYTVPVTMDHLEAFRLMTEHHYRHLAVTDAAGNIIGMVTETDFVRGLSKDYYIRLKDVGSVMAPVLMVRPTAALSDALGHLSGSEITCVVTSRADGELGILTERDAVRLLRDGVPADTTMVGDVMVSPIASITRGATLLEASVRMEALKIRRLVVVDDDGLAVGIVGQHEIVKGLDSEYVEHLEGLLAEKDRVLAELLTAKHALHEQSTLLRRTLDELSGAHADLSEFSSVAAHDLQEPLRLIVSYSQLLQRDCADTVQGDGPLYLAYIIENAKRMNQSVRDLLAYSMASSRFEELETIEAGEAAQTATGLLAAQIATAGAQVEIDPLPSVSARRSVLVEIFAGLISNAIKFRRPGQAPMVRIGVSETPAEWRFQVSDNGIGMEAEYLERIFGLFKKLHPADVYAGSGVGLAICRRLTELLGGRIWAESQFGQGSTLTFTIPKPCELPLPPPVGAAAADRSRHPVGLEPIL